MTTTSPWPAAWGSVWPPFWRSSVMERESAMLIRAAGAATADVPLLFAADTIRELRMADGNTVFEEGRDYVPANGGDAEVDAGDPAGSGTPSDHFDVGDSRLRELQALITEMSKVAPCPLSGPR